MGSMIRLVGVGALALGTSLAFGASPAQAAATCSLHTGPDAVSVRCADAPTSRQEYWAVAVCSNGETGYGPWYRVNSGVWSVAHCRYGSRAFGGGPQVA